MAPIQTLETNLSTSASKQGYQLQYGAISLIFSLWLLSETISTAAVGLIDLLNWRMGSWPTPAWWNGLLPRESKVILRVDRCPTSSLITFSNNKSLMFPIQTFSGYVDTVQQICTKSVLISSGECPVSEANKSSSKPSSAHPFFRHNGQNIWWLYRVNRMKIMAARRKSHWPPTDMRTD